ncbi:hypothetical protein E2C01_083065 [Portunus trituberculatus]|uniref:Uncharacterized protein n=1 Tax=Portunus trituberculatus TaxID=210409 RepID=A0A5B7IRH5_PORTR|nr:hypothetical protein [Portunus trituberculatus]
METAFLAARNAPPPPPPSPPPLLAARYFMNARRIWIRGSVSPHLMLPPPLPALRREKDGDGESHGDEKTLGGRGCRRKKE